MCININKATGYKFPPAPSQGLNETHGRSTMKALIRIVHRRCFVSSNRGKNTTDEQLIGKAQQIGNGEREREKEREKQYVTVN